MKKHLKLILMPTDAQKFKISEEYSLKKNLGRNSLLDQFEFSLLRSIRFIFKVLCRHNLYRRNIQVNKKIILIK